MSRSGRVVGAAACGIALLLGAVHAQSYGVPKLAWGDPDFEGAWTNATLTVLQRAPELAAKPFFTPEEAAAFDQQRAAMVQQRIQRGQLAVPLHQHPSTVGRPRPPGQAAAKGAGNGIYAGRRASY